jgi:RNA polymerase sigma factor (sigma-70 family)
MRADQAVENPYRSPALAVVTDGELLQRFISDKCEEAFEELIGRHGPMVYSACRGVLHSPQDAEDAFQATFLILVRQADSIRERNSFQSWLFGVARRVSMKALRAQYRRLQFLQRLVQERETVQLTPPSMEGEIWEAVNEELAGLSEIQRYVIQHCVFGGQSYRRIGEELNIPPATVASHLRRGRQALRRRLIGRGIGAAGLGAALTSVSCAVSAPSASVCKATIENAAAMLAGNETTLPVRIMFLMKGVTATMTTMSKFVLVLALSFGAGGSAWWASHGQADHQPAPGQDQPEIVPSNQTALELNVELPPGSEAPSSVEVFLEPSVR